ncbi:MAG: DNA polymerase Y family protein [Caulobacterales bacterium]
MNASPTGPRWLSLHLPRLSTDRVRRSGGAPADGKPFALYAKIGNAFILTGLDEAAHQAGLRAGLPLADARALRPDLAAQEDDETADAQLLDDIAAWCERFTPIVVIDAPDGLFLDITGCAHLFGGEAALLKAVKSGLRTQGFNVRAAIAPSPGAAWACARFGKRRLIAPDMLDAALTPLPLPALRLSDAAAALLKRLGLKTIGQIANAPRQPFSARAGQQALLRLDQAFGRAPEALTPRRPSPPVFALRKLAEPILTLDAVLIVTEALCGDLSVKLDQRGHGVRFLRLCLFDVNSKVSVIKLALSRAERDPKTMLRLLRERLTAAPETLNAEFGFEAMRLDAVEIAPIVFHATDLAPASKRNAAAETRLVDSIRARLGADRIGHVVIRDAHAPKRINQWSPIGEDIETREASPPQDNVMRRPLCIFTHSQPVEALASVPDGPPGRFRWRRVLHEVVRAEGPERIAADWLRAPGKQDCDYYRVEDREGRRFWLYREGAFGDPEAPPRWFIQGVFA